MITYEVDATFLVRCDTPSKWADATTTGKGANRILKKGEMGWEVGTSNFKIGDGSTIYSELSYIKPTPESSPYALRLGTENNYYTYSELKTIIDNLESVAERVYSLEDEVSSLKTSVTELETYKNRYYNTFADFPSIGVQGPIYIDKEKGDSYYFNVDTYQDKGVGYIKLNSFDILQAEL